MFIEIFKCCIELWNFYILCEEQINRNNFGKRSLRLNSLILETRFTVALSCKQIRNKSLPLYNQELRRAMIMGLQQTGVVVLPVIGLEALKVSWQHLEARHHAPQRRVDESRTFPDYQPHLLPT